MSQSPEKSSLENHLDDYLTQSKSYDDLAVVFKRTAVDSHAKPGEIVAATDIILANLAGYGSNQEKLQSDGGIIRFDGLVQELHTLATRPDMLKIMPESYNYHVANGMAECLISQDLPDYEANLIFTHITGIIPVNAKVIESDAPQIAALLCRLADTTVDREFLYPQVAELAVSGKLDLTGHGEIPRIINSFAGHFEPNAVESPLDKHVRAMQIFAENKGACDLDNKKVPALFTALANVDDLIKAKRTGEEYQGLFEAREAISKLVGHGQLGLFD